MESAIPVELRSLNELRDYRVCSDDIDPRGWRIVDSNSVAIGSVGDLIIDLQALIARYIVCSIPGSAREVLIPVGFARLDQASGTVYLDFVTAADVATLPPYVGLPLSVEFSTLMETTLTGEAPTTSPEAKIVRRSDATRNAS